MIPMNSTMTMTESMMSDYDIEDPWFDVDDYEYMQDLPNGLIYDV